MSEFLQSMGQIKQNWRPYEKWDNEQDNKEAQRKELHKRHPASKEESEQAKNYGHTLINAINVMDEYSEDKSQNMEQAVQSVAGFPCQIGSMAGMGAGALLIKKVKNPKYWLIINPVIMGFFGAALAYIPMSIWGTKVQVWAARVARFQAREKELKDPQNFVVYNSEQINQAKEIAKNLPNEKKEDLLTKVLTKNEIGEMFSTVKSVNEDKEAHKEWYKKYLEEDKNIKESYKDGIPAEKLGKTKADQEIIINTVKKINETAEEYSEDVETATNTAGTVFSLAGGSLIGAAIYLVCKGLEKAKIIKPDGMANKLRGTISGYVGFVSGLGLQLWFLHQQKEAARVGRFKAKQELMSDPQNFIYYDDKEKESVKDIKAVKSKKSFFAKVLSAPGDLINFFKDKRNYEKYKKTQGLEDKKFRKALKEIKPTEEQLVEAKNLQEKTFNTFEKLDEMSEKYSENMETVTDIANQSMPFVAMLGVASIGVGLWTLGEKYFKNKSPEEILTFITTKLDKFKNIKFVQSLKNDIIDASIETCEKSLVRGIMPQKGDFIVSFAKKPKILGTAAGIVAPFALGFIGLLFGVQAYYTKLQKKAGRIGVMKAIQELEDPRYFVDKYNSEKSSEVKKEDSRSESGQQQLNKNQNPMQKWLEKIHKQRTLAA